jgi:hypothetical protein
MRRPSATDDDRWDGRRISSADWMARSRDRELRATWCRAGDPDPVALQESLRTNWLIIGISDDRIRRRWSEAPLNTR